MKFSTRTSYALRALSCVVANHGRGLSIGAIAKTEKISPKYLEAIFSDLKKAGIITSVQGAQGGYKLAKRASATSVLAVVNALEKPEQLFYCIKNGQKNYCQPHCVCGVKIVNTKISRNINQTLSGIKLSELVK